MKQLSLGVVSALLFAATAVAQTPPLASQPDCASITFTFVGGNGIAPTLPTAYLDNRSSQCESWTLAYEADSGLSGYTVAFQSATGSTVPATFGAYAGNTVNSSPSFGTASLGLATYCNLATCTSGGTTVNTPWIRVLVSGATGTGNIRGVLYGYKTGYTGGTGSGGGGGGGGGGGSVTQGTIPWQEAPFGLSTLNTGQQAVTGTAVNLGTATSRVVCLVADIGNTITIYFGPSGVTTSTGTPLVAGQSQCLQLANTNLVYVIASTTGAKVEWNLVN